MNEENPFDVPSANTPDTEFYLLRIKAWEWTKTDSGDDKLPDFYDYSEGGCLLSAEAECPLCEGQGWLTAGINGGGELVVKDWVCMACGLDGNLVGWHGGGIITPNEDHDEHVFLPSCVVVEVEL